MESLRLAFLLGRAMSIIEGLIESPTDAIDIRMAQQWLDEVRELNRGEA
jgi:hypothetical protein